MRICRWIKNKLLELRSKNTFVIISFMSGSKIVFYLIINIINLVFRRRGVFPTKNMSIERKICSSERMNQIGNIKKEDYIVEKYVKAIRHFSRESMTGASEVRENKSSWRGRCLIEPPAGLDAIIVHVRECSRYATEAIVPGT